MNLRGLHDTLLEFVDDATTPVGARDDARLLLEQIGHLLPAEPAPHAGPTADGPAIPGALGSTWMSDRGTSAQVEPAELAQSTNLEAAPTPPIPAYRDMVPLARWVIDCGVTVNRFAMEVLSVQAPLAALAQTMSGVRSGTPLSDQLHADLQAVLAVYVPLWKKLTAA